MGPFEWLLIMFISSLIGLMASYAPQIVRDAFHPIPPPYRRGLPAAGAKPRRRNALGFELCPG